ncbi:MAG: single-stranded DNA-binding protein [Bradymonadaceae bacterium]
MTVNKAILVGRLGADPEVRSTQSGTPVANMRIATNRVWTDDMGQKQEETEWHRVVVFGKQAEACGNYLSKGRQVYVEGRIQTNEWEDRDGNERYTTEIVANTVQFLSGGDSGGGGARGSGGPPPPSEPPGGFDQSSGGGGGGGGGDYSDDSFDDDDIPF